MYRTAKSLELVEVEVHSCFIHWSYSFLHKTLIVATSLFIKFLILNIIYNYFPKIQKLDFVNWKDMVKLLKTIDFFIRLL